MKQLRANLDSSLSIQITIDSDAAGTYSKAFNSGGITVTYEINTIPSSLPFTLSIGDVLRVISTNVGYVELQ